MSSVPYTLLKKCLEVFGLLLVCIRNVSVLENSSPIQDLIVGKNNFGQHLRPAAFKLKEIYIFIFHPIENGF